jgi:hypothetical protein
MTTDARAESTVVAAPRVGAGVFARVSPAAWLVAMVTLSFVARLVVAFLHPLTNLFPDEYIYAELGRGFATHGLPLVRGHVASFPALLEPLITSPAWLVHDVGTSLRIIQTMTTLSMSLAAVPAYLLGRRLRLSTHASLAAAAVTLAVPEFFYATAATAEAFAYPLSLWATLAGIAALERPTRRRQAIFVAAALLTTLARTQFVAIPIAFAVAAVVVGLRERRLRRVLAEQLPVLALFALGGVAVSIVGLGFYGGVTNLVTVGKLGYPFAANSLVLALASGWVIVPGALIALVLGIMRPLDRVELAFCALVSAHVLAMLGQAAFFGEQAHERYVAYAAPLLALAFALYVRRGAPFRLAHAAASLGLLVLALRLPLGGLLGAGLTNSATLFAAQWLSEHLGSAGAASALVLNVALAGTALVLLVMARFPRAAFRIAMTFAVCFGTAFWIGASVYEHFAAARIRAAIMPADRSWVDHSGLGPVTMLRTFQSDRTDTYEQLFWNRSVDRVVSLNAPRNDPFSQPEVTVARNGAITALGKPVRGPLLMDEANSTVALRGGRIVATSPQFDLWKPGAGPARLASYFAGRTRGGLMIPLAVLELWPDRTSLAGTVRLVFTVPKGGPPWAVLHVITKAGGVRVFSIPSGTSKALVLNACSTGPWYATLKIVQGAAVEVSKPVFRAGTATCPASSGSSA